MQIHCKMKPKAKSSPVYRFLLAAVVLGAIFGGTAGAYLALTQDLPQIKSLEDYQPSAITRIYSSDQQLLAEIFIEKRDPVPLKKVPPMLVKALLATEDRKFYRHRGIALKGILRAVAANLKTGRFTQGASTITQQLAKTLFLTPRKTLTRKLKEAILALQLERRYTKDEILALYLNQVYFGSGAWGVASAARIFFGKPLEKLTLAECALIAGMPRAPSAYSPLVNPELAIRRRNLVLKQMYDLHLIDADLYRQAVAEPVQLADNRNQDLKAPYFVDFVKQELERQLGHSRLYKAGLTVETTLDWHLQQAAESAVAAGLKNLAARMQRKGLATGKLQAALVALDVRSGAILAMVGGRDDGQTTGYNRACEARRQPGSAFKPIVYALAIEKGFSQTDNILDAPVAFKNASGTDWLPQNFSRNYEGEITLRHALAHSKNIPAVRLVEKLGPAAVAQFAYKLGLSPGLREDLTLALGTSEVSLLNLTAAYATFANSGLYTRPYGIVRITGRHGRTVWTNKYERHLAMSPEAAAITTNMLQAVVSEGTGKAAGRLGMVAGKTGTTNDYRDALFIGYNPRIAAGVWVGNDDHRTLGAGETGARAALPIWIKFMEAVPRPDNPEYFDLPDGVKVLGRNKPRHPDGDTLPVLVRKSKK